MSYLSGLEGMLPGRRERSSRASGSTGISDCRRGHHAAMTGAPDTTTEVEILPPYARDAQDVVASARSDAGSGLTGAEAAERLARLGPHRITRGPPPPGWGAAGGPLRRPASSMLAA